VKKLEVVDFHQAQVAAYISSFGGICWEKATNCALYLWIMY